MLKQAVSELYSEFPYSYSLKYSGKFKPYRANVKLRGDRIQFSLSRKWKSVGIDIQIGLIQELLLRVLNKRLRPLKKNTENIELYEIFMKKLHIVVPKTDIDPFLEGSFDRVNEKYFYGLLEKTNLRWGFPSVSKLGSYEYGTDTIMISKVLENADREMLDYVMYHEMLHKKHKFDRRGNRSFHHTPEFKRKEREFENSRMIEQKLGRLLVKRRFSLRRIFNELF